MTIFKLLIVGLFSVLSIASQASSAQESISNLPSYAYLEGNDSKVGVVLCHGRGKHPRFSVVEPLRKGINKHLGYHTISIQMPKGSVGWRQYEEFFPEAHKNITAAVRFLKEKKGVEKVYLMGHSMGSRMATSYLAENSDSGIDGFIGAGIRNGGGSPLDSNTNLRSVNIPVIDIYGDGGDGKDAHHAKRRSDMVGDRYTQVFISGANHRFTHHENELVDAVTNWLRQQP